MKSINRTIEHLKPSGIRKYFDLANAMEGVISLGVGEPDFDTPWHISAKAVESFEDGHTHYTANRGLIALRRQIANITATATASRMTPTRRSLSPWVARKPSTCAAAR